LSGPVVIEVAGILFDNDGVIVSSIASVNRSWKRWAAEYGVPDADKVEIEHGTRAVEIMDRLVPGIDKVKGLRRIEDIEIDDVADLEVLPGVRRLLESLPAGRWAIVSSATHRLLLGRLEAARLPVPERIISGEMVARGKPDPEPYRRGAELIGAAPKDCLVIEDAPSGVGAGVAAGCSVLGVLGTHSAEDLRAAGASGVVRTLEDVQAERMDNGLHVTMQAL
jgi:sugar-phosphatase